MTKDYQEIERIVEEFNKTFKGCDQCQYGDGQGTWMVDWLRTTFTSLTEAHKVEMEKMVEEILTTAEVLHDDIGFHPLAVSVVDIKEIAKKFNIEVK